MIPPGKIFLEKSGIRTEFVGIDDTITTGATMIIMIPDAEPDTIHFYNKETGEKIMECPAQDFLYQLDSAISDAKNDQDWKESQ